MPHNMPKCAIFYRCTRGKEWRIYWTTKQKSLGKPRLFSIWWGRVDSNHRRHCQQIYSLKKV